MKRLYFIWNRLSLKAFEKVVADSRSDAAIFSAICPGIERIPNGILFDEFQVERRPEPWTLLYIGRVSRNKRIDCLIETTALLKKSLPEVKLKIVGEDWEGIRKELEVLAEKMGVRENVEFLGKADRGELLEHLSKATFFVSASQYEGFGISVIEAMAAGCVPIVNDITAFREFIEDGKNGFIVDFFNPQSAAIRIQRLFETDLSNVVRASKKTALRYSWDEVIVKIEEIYKDILQREKV
jgi:alpha-1,3-mannosyltransferase